MCYDHSFQKEKKDASTLTALPGEVRFFAWLKSNSNVLDLYLEV